VSIRGTALPSRPAQPVSLHHVSGSEAVPPGAVLHEPLLYPITRCAPAVEPCLLSMVKEKLLVREGWVPCSWSWVGGRRDEVGRDGRAASRDLGRGETPLEISSKLRSCLLRVSGMAMLLISV